ncbi:hypothetical protein BGX29_005555 [Mortierella sp. GBA35]|nr:hypothetical protein BGX23_012012 [Mortierella sp. AD031]KAF9107626.1 hypothetical protein BGX29_005555 [Mortierella sp. GBA35]KAG0200040.1 hypothetical protein BGX33_011245 [Mortierella sp. NVP41]
MPAQFLASRPDITMAAAQRVAALAPYLTPSVTINLGLGGYHLMVGLLLGVVKYQQIHASKTYTAHPYISTAHRASLMYGFASAQLAGIALLSSFSEKTNVWATIATQSFFVQAVLMYAAHGLMRDTTNQLKPPHRVGDKHSIPPWMVRGFMVSLILAEVVGCGVLILGMLKTFANVLSNA